MTMVGVGDVVNLLTANGYIRADQPLEIGGLGFTFSAALVGEAGNPELVVVSASASEGDLGAVTNRIEALSRALDIVRSRRTLSIVLVGTTPDERARDRLQRLGRLLLVPDNADSLSEPLAILLPFAMPDTADAADPVTRLRESLRHPPHYVEALLHASRGGTVKVAKELRATLAEPFIESAPK